MPARRVRSSGGNDLIARVDRAVPTSSGGWCSTSDRTLLLKPSSQRRPSDRGHLFNRAPDQDKRALIEFLKTM